MRVLPETNFGQIAQGTCCQSVNVQKNKTKAGYRKADGIVDDNADGIVRSLGGPDGESNSYSENNDNTDGGL